MIRISKACRRVICSAVVFTLLMLCFPAQAKAATVAGTGSSYTVRLKVGEKTTLTSALKKPVWGSSDRKIATVSKKGVVRAKRKGRCFVSAVFGGRAEVFTVIVRKAAKKPAGDLPEAHSEKLSFEGRDYVLAFCDEFDEFDLKSWSYCPEMERQDAGGVWRRSCSGVKDGNLVITCEVDENGRPQSGAVRTTEAVAGTFGLYHFRFKVDKADGLWYAFWLLTDKMEDDRYIGNGATDGAELDIIELVPHESEFCMSVHWDGYGPELKSYSEVNRDLIDDSFYESYHDVWYVWDSEGYRFYMDGTDKEHLLFDFGGDEHGDGTCSVPCDLIISAEFGAWGGAVDKEQLPARFLVDFVEIYRAE